MRRRDRTSSIGRRVRSHLSPSERVVAGVAVALPGTARSRMVGGAAAGTGSTVVGRGNEQLEASAARVQEVGITRGFQFFLVLTDARVILVRRSAFGRAKEVVFQVPLEAVAELRTGIRSMAVYLDLADGRSVRLETPNEFKFLPDVYRQLPERFAAAAER